MREERRPDRRGARKIPPDFIDARAAADALRMVPASKESEAGVLPDEKIIADMQKFNEEMVKAGFGAQLTPELREKEERLREKIAAKK